MKSSVYEAGNSRMEWVEPKPKDGVTVLRLPLLASRRLDPNQNDFVACICQSLRLFKDPRVLLECLPGDDVDALLVVTCGRHIDLSGAGGNAVWHDHSALGSWADSGSTRDLGISRT
jgi:hypothetical protein